MKAILALATAMLLSTAAHAELIGVYSGQLTSNQTLIVGLDDKPATGRMCSTLNDPREVRASLKWYAVTEAVTPYSNGCWGREGDKVVIYMTSYADSSPVDIRLSPKDIRQTGRGFNLWPTANQQTLEFAAGAELPGDVIATAASQGSTGTVLIQLTDAPAATCYGEDAKVARVTALGGQRAETLACWSKGRFEVVVWTDSANRNEYGTVDPNFVIETEQFQKTAAFHAWN